MSRVWTRKGKHRTLNVYAEEVVKSAKRRRISHLGLPWIAECSETKAFVEVPVFRAAAQRGQQACRGNRGKLSLLPHMGRRCSLSHFKSHHRNEASRCIAGLGHIAQSATSQDC